MLNEVKHLANVSCQVPARDSSDATLCQNDTQRGGEEFMDNCYIISKNNAWLINISCISMICFSHVREQKCLFFGKSVLFYS